MNYSHDKLIIALDIDNVICNTTETLLQYINERLPLELTMEDITDYWIEQFLPPQYKWIVEDTFHNKIFWKGVEPISGAAYFIEKLYRKGHEIYFATATTPDNFRKKISFLRKNLKFFPDKYIEDHMISIKTKTLLSVDIMVDDYLDNLTGERSYYSICLDYPWNRELKEPDPWLDRAANWKEVYDIITSLDENLIKYNKKLNNLCNKIILKGRE